MYTDDLDAFLAAYEAWEAEEAANAGLPCAAFTAAVCFSYELSCASTCEHNPGQMVSACIQSTCCFLHPAQQAMTDAVAACFRMLCSTMHLDSVLHSKAVQQQQLTHKWVLCCAAKLSEQQRRALLKGTGKGRAQVCLRVGNLWHVGMLEIPAPVTATL